MKKLRRRSAWRLEAVISGNPTEADDNLCSREQAIDELIRRVSEEQGTFRAKKAADSLDYLGISVETARQCPDRRRAVENEIRALLTGA